IELRLQLGVGQPAGSRLDDGVDLGAVLEADALVAGEAHAEALLELGDRAGDVERGEKPAPLLRRDRDDHHPLAGGAAEVATEGAEHAVADAGAILPGGRDL